MKNYTGWGKGRGWAMMWSHIKFRLVPDPFQRERALKYTLWFAQQWYPALRERSWAFLLPVPHVCQSLLLWVERCCSLPSIFSPVAFLWRRNPLKHIQSTYGMRAVAQWKESGLNSLKHLLAKGMYAHINYRIIYFEYINIKLYIVNLIILF